MIARQWRPPPAAAPTLDAKSVAMELAKVLGVKRDGGIFGGDDSFTDAGPARAAYLEFAERNPGRIAFKELEGMMGSLFLLHCRDAFDGHRSCRRSILQQSSAPSTSTEGRREQQL